jgi:hypothetical protein
MLTHRRRGAKKRDNSNRLSLSAPLRLCVRFLILSFFAAIASAEDIDPVKIAILVDGMATRGANYDATELHALGADGLAAVIDHLLPDTAPPPKPNLSGPPEAEIRRLLGRLDADEFPTREAATQALIATARGRRDLIQEAARGESLEVRMRADRVLASWDPHYAERLNAYLSGFWNYLEGISDPPRLLLLAQRTLQAFEPGMPEGDRLHLLRLCIAGVAHGHDDASCDILRPLVRHDDERIALLATETLGAYKTEPGFVPEALVDALGSDRPAIVETALRFLVGHVDARRRDRVRRALRTIFETRDEPLKFQACLPLMRDYADTDAWLYVLEQTISRDEYRVRTARNWIGDTRPLGQPADARLLKRLDELLAGKVIDQRRVGIQVLGIFAGAPVVQRLIDLLGDADIGQEAASSLRLHVDRPLVQSLLESTLAGRQDPLVRQRCDDLLANLKDGTPLSRSRKARQKESQADELRAQR